MPDCPGPRAPRFAFLGRSVSTLRRHPRVGDGKPAELGSFLGYPPCCVASFAAWKDRRGSAKEDDVVPSIARASAGIGPFPFLLNNLYNFNARLEPGGPKRLRLPRMGRGPADGLGILPVPLPWHPCSYGCAPSLGAAARIWAFLERFLPKTAASLREALSGDFLYLGRFEAVVLKGASAAPGGVRYAGVDAARSALPAENLRLLRSGDSLRLEPKAAVVAREGRDAGRLERPSPLLLRFS